jgi:hypothetical protein
MKVIFYYYCNYDSSDIFFHFPANIWVAGWSETAFGDIVCK